MCDQSYQKFVRANLPCPKCGRKELAVMAVGGDAPERNYYKCAECGIWICAIPQIYSDSLHFVVVIRCPLSMRFWLWLSRDVWAEVMYAFDLTKETLKNFFNRGE